MAAPLFALGTGFWSEAQASLVLAPGNEEQALPSFALEDSPTARYYRMHFYDKDHSIYVGRSRDLEAIVLALIRETVVVDGASSKSPDSHHYRALLFTKGGRRQCLIPPFAERVSNEALFTTIALACGLEARAFTDIMLVKPASHAKLASELLKLEEMDTPQVPLFVSRCSCV